MARTALSVTTLTQNTAFATGTAIGTAIDATNSHALTVAYPLDSLVVRIVNTTNATKVATIKAGANPPATAAGQGDLAVSLTDGSTTPQVKSVVLESARFLQADGTLNIDIEAGMTGYIAVLRTPRA